MQATFFPSWTTSHGSPARLASFYAVIRVIRTLVAISSKPQLAPDLSSPRTELDRPPQHLQPLVQVCGSSIRLAAGCREAAALATPPLTAPPPLARRPCSCYSSAAPPMDSTASWPTLAISLSQDRPHADRHAPLLATAAAAPSQRSSMPNFNLARWFIEGEVDWEYWNEQLGRWGPVVAGALFGAGAVWDPLFCASGVCSCWCADAVLRRAVELCSAIPA